MFIRQLEYMVALARERHFVRAAQSCSVSQPALSEGIRKLEKELDVPLIRRGNKFEGLTAEGQELVTWAHRILADRDAMNDEIAAMRTGVSGQLRFGSVPTASIAVSLLNAPFCGLHPRASVQVVSDLTSQDVLGKLRSFEIDAGITYIQDPVPEEFRVLPLYLERHVLLTSRGAMTASSATWAQAAALPLCLLAPSMQGRRRLDGVFAEVGAVPAPRLETDSVASLFAHVQTGSWSTIVPAAWLHLFGVSANLQAVPLVSPRRSVPVGLVTLARDPAPVLVRALLSVAESTDLTFLEHLPGEKSR
ncbi:LysR family transcriptional regulator [Paeniglutamicibacter psychrophenolicus]|uniref:LysR family transcriptional regulator n=1 Tax=Paeniglutamicibacter psychrophenolicus TaxID=257454 RepID=UPI00277FF53D|nr:LysR family transcriptional regulator [Paeniglutamicibacter psychrophenolicus]MDQ0092852.1 DNA-binding transcriptional LysR family regulator [Paeniglutamicibacter psychrophenolicus]